MMGRRDDGQVQFLYAFDLDKVVPPDHLVQKNARRLVPAVRAGLKKPPCPLRGNTYNFLGAQG
jgi:hypothetical protein